MKRRIICGLLLACSIMLGLSFAGSSDVSALKYSYSRFPVLHRNYYGLDVNQARYNNYSFSFSLDTTGIPSTALQNWPLPEGKQKQRQWLAQSGGGYCNNFGDHDHSIWSSYYNSSLNSIRFYSEDSGYLQLFDRLDYPLASDFNSLQSSNVVDCANSRTYDYDSIVGGKINVSTGDYTDYVDIPNAFNFSARGETIGLEYIDVPLSIYPEALKSVPAGTPLEWNFELFSTEQLTDVYVNPSAKLQLRYSSYDPDSYTGSYSSLVISSAVQTCSVDPDHEFLILEEGTLGVNIYAYGYKVTCSYTAPTDMAYINARLVLSNEDDSSPLFKFSENLFFGSSYLVTDNDDTWSGLDISFPLTGDDITKAPGYAAVYCDNAAGCDQNSTSCNTDDFLCRITKGFDFSFINPFAPIFQLFSDNSSCAQIPTIAGMIHSNETQVCPWFPANVRAITTPVLGISSMMLLFGFAVRWLGSSSGNLFEDSSSETLAPPGWSGHWGRRKK